MTASPNISLAFTKKKSKKNKDNFVKIEFEVHNLTQNYCQLLWSILAILTMTGSH